MSNNEYDILKQKIDKIKSYWRQSIPTHASLIKEIIEKFESPTDVKITGVYDNHGLCIGVGFQEFWLDEQVLGANSAKMFYEVTDAINKILNIPHASNPKTQDIIKELGLSRNIGILDFTITTSIGTLIYSPFPEIEGFIVMFVESIYDVALTKKNLVELKKELVKIISNKKDSS